MNIFIVRSEIGLYSDWTTFNEAAFLTKDAAKNWIQSDDHAMFMYHHVGTKYFNNGLYKPIDEWTADESYEIDKFSLDEKQVITKVVETKKVIPESSDGITYSYNYPNYECFDEWTPIYFIECLEVIED